MITKEEMAQVRRNAEKHALAKSMMLTQDSTFIHFNPLRLPHLTHIPQGLRLRSTVVFQIGSNLPVPIPDLEFDAMGFTATLSFKGVPFKVTVPWTSVYALVGSDERGRVWTDDMPPEVASAASQEEARVQREFEEKKTQRKLKSVTVPPGWRVIPGGKN